MTSAPRHTHDTLVEALCEFRLAPSTTPGWTAKSPGQLLNQLQAEFPNMEPVNAKIDPILTHFDPFP